MQKIPRQLRYVAALAIVALIGAAIAVADTPGEHIATATHCETVTSPGSSTPAHDIADNGTTKFTIPGASTPNAVAIACATATATATDNTVTVTVTQPPTTTAPSPPPSKLRFGNGKVDFKYGDSYGPQQCVAGQGYDRYGVVVVGYGDDWKVGCLPNAKGLMYRLLNEVMTGCGAQHAACQSAISYDELTPAQRDQLLLKNTNGQFLTGVNGNTYYVGDAGSFTYQDMWATNVLQRMAQYPDLDGIYIDNAGCDVTALTNDVIPSKYPDFASRRAAILSFLTNVSKRLQNAGKYVMIGTGCGNIGDMAKALPWWQDVAAIPNGTLYETFMQSPCGCTSAGYNDVYFESPTTSWLGHWKEYLGTMDTVQNAGTDYYAISTAVANTSAANKYAAASFLLKWDGQHGGFGVGTGSVPDAWPPFTDVGTPSGPMVQSGKAFYRLYSGGKVIVNPDPSASVNVLGVTLAPKTAYIGA